MEQSSLIGCVKWSSDQSMELYKRGDYIVHQSLIKRVMIEIMTDEYVPIPAPLCDYGEVLGNKGTKLASS